MKHTCRSLGAGPLRRAGLPPLCTQRRARTYPVVCHACMRPWTAVVQNVGSQGCGLPHGPLNFHLLLRARLRVPCCCPPAMAIACWNNGAGCRTVCVLYFWHYLRCMTRYRNAMYSRLSLCTPPCTLVFFPAPRAHYAHKTIADPRTALWRRDLPSLAHLCPGNVIPNRKIAK